MTYGNGHYERREDGVWIYRATGAEVPGASDLRIGRRLTMVAPEVHPEALLTTDQVAAELEVQPASFRSMVARGEAPVAVFKFGNQPLWTRPVIAQWRAARPGRGGRAA